MIFYKNYYKPNISVLGYISLNSNNDILVKTTIINNGSSKLSDIYSKTTDKSCSKINKSFKNLFKGVSLTAIILLLKKFGS